MIKEGTFCRLKDEDEFVEVVKKPDYTPDKFKSDDWAYVCTRTPYATSLFGQIESCGFVHVNDLIPLDKSKKKDRELIEKLKKVQEEGIERSAMWYKLYKSKP